MNFSRYKKIFYFIIVMGAYHPFIVNAFLYETNRHIEAGCLYTGCPYGPWINPVDACKAEVNIENYPNNFTGIEPSQWPHIVICKCVSNSGAGCGFAAPVCPIGRGKLGVHTDYRYGSPITLAYPGWDSADPDTYGCPVRTADKFKNIGVGCGIGGSSAGSPSGVGNPINQSTGNKFQVETDYVVNGVFPFILKRVYNSDSIFTSSLGEKWIGSFESKISYDSFEDSSLFVHRPTGQVLFFWKSSSGVFISDSDISDKLIKLVNASGQMTGWQYKVADTDTTELYDAEGKLLSITNRSGLQQVFGYNNNLLQTITTPDGRVIVFSYDSLKRLSLITFPLGSINYSYNSLNMLVNVTYSGNAQRIYHYENSSFPKHLTGITDENGQRYATFSYDNQGRGITTEHANGVSRYTLNYNTDGTTSVTDPLGNTVDYSFQTVQGMIKIIGLNKACSTCGGSTQFNSYDSNGNISSRIDFKGNRISYIYDLSRNLETQRTEGLTAGGSITSVTRTINTAWHAIWRLPTIITEPLKKTSYAYGGDTGVTCGVIGKVCTKTEQATSDVNGSQGFNAVAVGSPRVWTYTYNANGQLLTANGPRTDVNDVTTYIYYTDTTTTHRPGDLATITNALGHVTTFNSYDANGRLTSITAPSLQSTTITYTARGKIKSLSGEVNVTYNYDAADQLTQVSFTQGRTYTYAYDNAHRLLSITSGTGEKLTYILDNVGNRLSTTLTDVNGLVTTQHRQVFDALGQLQQSIATVQGLDATTSYTYDANGQLQTETSPLNEVTTYNYDSLNRINNTQEVLNGVILTTQSLQNGQDVSTSVQAPNGVSTSYVPNGYGEINSEASTDRGAVSYTYDSAGNLKTRTDGRNITLTYTYDALNRPITLTSPVSAENITYTYDANTTLTNCHGTGTAGKGHLCKVVDQSGTTALAYDAQGNVTKLAKQTNGVTSSFQFTYNAVNQRMTTLLPGNRYIVNNRDSEKRIKSIDISLNGVNTTVVSNITYRPDGQVKTLTFNNGETLNNSYDTGGNLTLTARSHGNTSEAFHRDLDGQLTSRVLTSYTRSFQYDALHRLTNMTGGLLLHGISYDNNGNRLSKGVNVHTYANGSNRLATRNANTITHDAAGNATSNGLGWTYVWNSLGQLSQVNANGVKKATYWYNYLNQRIQKIVWNGTTVVSTTVYHYDPQGRLLMETSGAGAVQAIYVYGDAPRPLVMIQAANSPYNSTAQDKVVYLQTDHLGTPRAATDSAKRVVWRWEMQSDAFGADGAQQDPDGDGIATIIHLRFPGQYSDTESGLFYNWNRYYDASLGRYISSDPIGLAGGLNTYGYVGQSPLNQVDVNGLNPGVAAGAGVGGLVGGPPGAVVGGVIGALLGGAAAYTLFNEDASQSEADNSTSDSCEEDKPHCSMASPYQITQAGIDNEHDFKKDYVGGSLSRYDICACTDGSIKIAGRGQCGKSGPKIDTWARWK